MTRGEVKHKIPVLYFAYLSCIFASKQIVNFCNSRTVLEKLNNCYRRQIWNSIFVDFATMSVFECTRVLVDLFPQVFSSELDFLAIIRYCWHIQYINILIYILIYSYSYFFPNLWNFYTSYVIQFLILKHINIIKSVNK